MDEDVLGLLQLGDDGVQEVLVDAEDGDVAELVALLEGPVLQTQQGHLIPVLVIDHQHLLQDEDQQLAQLRPHLLGQHRPRPLEPAHLLLQVLDKVPPLRRRQVLVRQRTLLRLELFRLPVLAAAYPLPAFLLTIALLLHIAP